MDKGVVCLVFHGIGSYRNEHLEHIDDAPGKRFEADLERAVKATLSSRFDRVHWVPVWWSNGPIFRRQETLFDERKPKAPWRWAFEGAINALSDASAFQLPPDYPLNLEAYRKSAYFEIVSAVRRKLKEVEAAHGGDLPVVLFAHSMGAHVASSYAWDAARDPGRLAADDDDEPSEFQKLSTLRSVIFTGCNIPLLTIGVDRKCKVPMRVPADRGGMWRNFYDLDDPLGYPLANEYQAYFGSKGGGETAFEGKIPPGRDPSSEIEPDDLKVKTAGWKGRTPWSHVLYWEQPRVVNALVEALLQAGA